MRKAKIGFEDIFNNATAKLETLEAEAKAKAELEKDKRVVIFDKDGNIIFKVKDKE